ncbi:MAG: beta-lactamase family protein, partial [Acidobacteriota bacterium]|nr:beta-lactamase family protein [Acidobacteriota bacterium]
MKVLIVFCLNFALVVGNSIAIQAQSKTKSAKAGRTPDATSKTSSGSSGSPSGSIDPERLARIPERMKSFVKGGRAAGIVTLLAARGKVVQLSAIGMQDLESSAPMKEDTIFQIASMTKPITCVGV